jgi:hypothetical protein
MRKHLENKELALKVGGVVFGLAALVHLYRVVTGTDLVLGGVVIAVPVSYAAVIVAGFLCGWYFWLSKR